MIFVDTNVFVIALRYPRDVNAEANRVFLDKARRRGDAVTGAWNLIELCGVLSFNLNARQLRALAAHFERRFAVRVVPAVDDNGALVPESARDLLRYLERRFSAGDALVAAAIERLEPAPRALVSWDAVHFKGKLAVPAILPSDRIPA